MENLLQILPQLGIGVVAVIGLVYVCKLFVDKMENRDKEFGKEFAERDKHFRTELREREVAFRELEKEIRGILTVQLGKNTTAMERIITYLEAPQTRK